MATVGIRELRDHLSGYLRRVREGELLVITDRGTAVGELGPPAPAGCIARAKALVRQGIGRWDGGKPRGLAHAPRPSRGLVSDAVVADRR